MTAPRQQHFIEKELKIFKIGNSFVLGRTPQMSTSLFGRGALRISFLIFLLHTAAETVAIIILMTTFNNLRLAQLPYGVV